MQLASVVMFVRELDVSVDFYRRLLGMEVAVRSPTAALLVNADGLQVYLRAVGANATRSLGGVGVQYVIWTAADEEDLWRCERFLKEAKAHVYTRTGDGFTLVEGSDPNGVPVMVAYPGPDVAVRTRIMTRVYAW
ncbi:MULTISPECIES: VOC family protein [unclassified Nonomuraea]|uniref:VOC family protein n=1 Tax=unclassified Nonomuraea TaxID=2593643 RepID=UPI0033C57EEC